MTKETLLEYEDLVYRLEQLDEAADLLDDSEDRFEMVIVGGGALILQRVLSRSTYDIDALYVPPVIQGLLTDFSINTRVNAYINNFAYNFEDRLVKLPIDGKKIDFYVAAVEDIVISKLHSIRTPDIEDVESEAVRAALDWNLLDVLATSRDELQASSLSQFKYREFLHGYNQYVEKFRP